jgi:hypothetical protein
MSLYAVLQAMGVPSRLVIYPNENHWILSPQNAIHWNWEVQSCMAGRARGWRSGTSVARQHGLPQATNRTLDEKPVFEGA